MSNMQKKLKTLVNNFTSEQGAEVGVKISVGVQAAIITRKIIISKAVPEEK